eukprot:gb/GFBE01062528.1/.p1 GENE.gb/GFBE01062528.1/~~gb/GFBE01062528.1/.p1  ORF type:complete len:406 (+),score=81.88 gb/GFBE01062528.1/:1-1218(+)
MKRGYEDSGPGGGSRRRVSGDAPRARHCLKALLPDGITSSLLGSRGAVKDQLQEESGARIVFSNKGDYFPQTELRVLGLFADDPESLVRAMDRIIGKIVDSAQDEINRSPPAGQEQMGRDKGEYIVRLCLSRQMAGLVIGSQGSTIQAVRRECGVKINIRDETVAGHRVATITGIPESLMEAMRRINDLIQHDCDTEEFQQYMRAINFGGEAHEGGWGYDGHAGKGGSKGSAPPPRLDAKAAQAMQLLEEDFASLPPGTGEMSYSVSCAIPANLVGALVGRSGDFVRSVEERTGAKVDISREAQPGAEAFRKMECIGPLLSIYAAHTMMMQRLQEVEDREEQPPPPAARKQSEWAERPQRGSRNSEWSERSTDAGSGKGLNTKQQALLATIASLEKQLAQVRRER